MRMQREGEECVSLSQSSKHPLPLRRVELLVTVRTVLGEGRIGQESPECNV